MEKLTKKERDKIEHDFDKAICGSKKTIKKWCDAED